MNSIGLLSLKTSRNGSDVIRGATSTPSATVHPGKSSLGGDQLSRLARGVSEFEPYRCLWCLERRAFVQSLLPFKAAGLRPDRAV